MKDVVTIDVLTFKNLKAVICNMGSWLNFTQIWYINIERKKKNDTSLKKQKQGMRDNMDTEKIWICKIWEAADWILRIFIPWNVDAALKTAVDWPSITVGWSNSIHRMSRKQLLIFLIVLSIAFTTNGKCEIQVEKFSKWEMNG